MAQRRDEPRIWAHLDRSVAPPPQQKLAHDMRAAPTDAERKLWLHLRYRLNLSGTHFRRQVRIDRYIVDFACKSAKLIVEVDGGQHDQQAAADLIRTHALEARGYRVLRFWNNDVLGNIDGVVIEIQNAITAPPPQPSP